MSTAKPNRSAAIPASTLGDTLRFIHQTLAVHFPGHSPGFASDVFARVEQLFDGQYPGYQRCDMLFHDFTHTLDATMALVRILDGHLKRGRPPRLTARDYESAVAAVLLHDSGYFKAVGDNAGTGAKYTKTHVPRSEQFAAKFLPAFGVTGDEIITVQQAIRCTGLYVDTARIPFRNEPERFLGYALGTGDMLGQLAAPQYPERLPGLYREFVEGGLPGYSSAEDLMRKTREFVGGHVRQMLDTQWGGAHKALEHHFPDSRNHYFAAIEANLQRLEQFTPGTPA